MFLTRLKVSGFRNIAHAEVFPSRGLNLIYGQNGSGKTSLLESIYALSRGHSFRTRKYTDLISRNGDSFVLYADVEVRGQKSRIGVARPRVEPSHFRLDGRNVHSVQELVAFMPTQVIDAHVFLLLEGGPRARRMFLDWLVFHVKHDFGDVWRRYTRALKQRNSLLRHGKIPAADFTAWDIELARYGSTMDLYRRDTLEAFVPQLGKLLQEAGTLADLPVTIKYAAGWDSQTDLREQLRSTLERDRKQGHTSIGPHRSDLVIKCHGKEPTSFLSRGQQKTLVCALHIAQIKSLVESSGAQCLVLVDDLPAELDSDNRKRLCQWLSATGCQVFASGVEAGGIAAAWPTSHSEQPKLFHVKHGSVVEQNYSFGADNDPE